MSLSSINSCTVIAEGAEGEDKHIVAYVVLQEKTSRKDLRAALKRRLPFFMVPSYFVFLERLGFFCGKKMVQAGVRVTTK